MPADELLSAFPVQLRTPIENIVSRAGVKALCELCGEEILNEREVVRDGAILCRACAGQAYYGIAAGGTLLNFDSRTVSQDLMALLSAE
jgi:formylmethanofuran dehydrogenase subunit E